jgi:hypothetical protein
MDNRSHVEEGLNEHGEAPPPYIPKNALDGAPDAAGPAIPLQTLRREDAGLAKPPDYEPPSTTITTTEAQNGVERSARFA